MSVYAGVAQDLVNLYRATPTAARGVLVTPLREAKDWLISDALVTAGVTREFPDPRKHIWRVQVKHMTGNSPDHNAYCEAELKTRSSWGCRNRPMLGAEHCHRHASEQEKVVAAERKARWDAYVEQALLADGTAWIVKDIVRALGGEA